MFEVEREILCVVPIPGLTETEVICCWKQVEKQLTNALPAMFEVEREILCMVPIPGLTETEVICCWKQVEKQL